MDDARRIPEEIREMVPEILTRWRELRVGGPGDEPYVHLCERMERVILVFTAFLESGKTVDTFSQGGAVRRLVREIAASQHELGRDAVGVMEDFAALRRSVWGAVEKNVDLSGLDGGEVSRFFAKMLDASDWVTEAGLEAFDGIVREETERAIGRAAATDLLTGLPDRDLLGRLLLPRAIDEHGRLAIAVFDVARFSERVAAGEVEIAREAVLSLADAVRELAPEEAVVARFGDDEVCVVLPCEGTEAAYEIAEQVLQRLSAEGLELHVGVGEYPMHGESAEELVAEIMKALKMAKRVGGSGIVAAR